MATIFDAATSADRLSATLGRIYQPQLGATGLAKLVGPQLGATGLAKLVGPQLGATGLAKLVGPQLGATGLAKLVVPLLTDLLALEGLEPNSPNIDTAPSTGDQQLQKLSDREIAAMLTLVAFLFVYFSLGLLVKYNVQAAEIAATDGPTPFEAAMAIGALVFWLWMNHSGRTNGR